MGTWKDESKKDRLSTVLWNLIQGISEGARLLEPYMPSTSKKILEQLGNGHVTENRKFCSREWIWKKF